MDVPVAESALAIPMAYNSQTENPSRYQKRQTSYLYPSQSGDLLSSNGTMIYRFLVGSSHFLDCKKSYFSFVAQITTAIGSNTAYFTSNTNTWIKRILISTASGIAIEEIKDQNIIASVLNLEMEDSYAESVGSESLAMWDRSYRTPTATYTPATVSPLLTGTLTPAQKEKLSYQPNRYVLTLDSSGFLNSFNYLPLAALSQGNSNGFQIELEFASANECIVAYGANYGTNAPAVPFNYKVSNCYFVQSLLVDEMKEQEILQLIKETPIILSFNTHRHFSNQINGSSSQHTISISEFQEQVQDIKFVFRDNAHINLQQFDSTKFVNPNLKQVQIQVGPTYFPSQPMVVGSSVDGDTSTYSLPVMGEMYNEYVKTCQKIKKYNYGFENNVNMDIVDLDTTLNVVLNSKDYQSMVVPFDFRIFGDDAVGDPRYNQYFSGLNLKANPQPIQFIFTLDNGYKNLLTNEAITAITYKVDSFTTYRNNIVVQAGQVYVIA